MPKQKDRGVPPKLTEAEQDLLTPMEQGYELETDSLGGNPSCADRKMMKSFDPSPLIGAQLKHWKSAA